MPKLAGIIAVRRKQLDVARARFEESRGRNAADCETGYYLGMVLAEQRVWSNAADIFIQTSACLEGTRPALQKQIEEIRASKEPDARKARKIAGRERQIAAAERMHATSSFNTAVACFNLGRRIEARQYAEKVESDEQFGERARDLLSRLR